MLDKGNGTFGGISIGKEYENTLRNLPQFHKSLMK
jgi:hypothetical protein